jgi:hypothetical protein
MMLIPGLFVVYMNVAMCDVVIITSTVVLLMLELEQ